VEADAAYVQVSNSGNMRELYIELASKQRALTASHDAG
jgi:hypothetical protein